MLSFPSSAHVTLFIHFPSYQHYHIVPSILLCKILMFYMYFMVKKASATHRPQSSPPHPPPPKKKKKQTRISKNHPPSSFLYKMGWSIGRGIQKIHLPNTKSPRIAQISQQFAWIIDTLGSKCWGCHLGGPESWLERDHQTQLGILDLFFSKWHGPLFYFILTW